MAREIDFKVNVETEASVAELRKLKQELRKSQQLKINYSTNESR